MIQCIFISKIEKQYKKTSTVKQNKKNQYNKDG